MTPSLKDIRAFAIKLGPRNLTFNLYDLMVFGVVLVAVGLLFRFPGSLPPGWHSVDGSVSSVVGKKVHGATQYYPVVQYFALGYTYDITSHHGYSEYPDLGAPFRVAFDPNEPETAKLVSDSNPNYFALLPWVGLVAVATGTTRYLLAIRRHHIAEAERMTSAAEPVELVTQTLPEEAEVVAEDAVDIPAVQTEAVEQEPQAIDETALSAAVPETAAAIKPAQASKKAPAKRTAKAKPKTKAKTPSKKTVATAKTKRPAKKTAAAKPAAAKRAAAKPKAKTTTRKTKNK